VLASLATELRRLTRLRPDERRALAAALAALGLPTREIAEQVGVCDRCVRYYVHG
jgi:predicted transcriptional regulator